MNASEIYEAVTALSHFGRSPESWAEAVARVAAQEHMTVEQVEAICDREYDLWAASRGYDN